MGLQFRDVSVRDDRLRVRIRPNHSRRLKTQRARRVIEMPLVPAPAHGLSITDWVAIERQRLRYRHKETAFIFTSDDAPFDATSRKEISADCVDVCREVTGRSNARLHLLRHLVAMEHTTPVFLTASDRDALAAVVGLAEVPTQQGDLALPRDLLGQVVGIGHVDPDTTLRSYHHVLVLLRSRTDAWLAGRYVKRSILSPLLGVTPHALDWALKQRPGREKALAWLDVALPPREVPQANASAGVRADHTGSAAWSGDILDGKWTARSLDGLLKDVARVGSLEPALQVRGEDGAQAAALRLRILAVEARLGRRLLEEQGRARETGVPSRIIRHVKEAREMEALLDWYDKDHMGRRTLLGGLADELWEFLQPLHADRIHLPERSMAHLHNLLLDLGVEPSRISYLPDASGLLVMRVLCREQTDKQARSAERYLGILVKRTMMMIRLATQGSGSASPVATYDDNVTH